MTIEQRAAWTTLPRIGGFVVDPRYLPDGPEKAEYITKLGQWCRANHRADWPSWLVRFVEIRRLEAARRPRDVGPAVPEVVEGGI